MTFQEAALCAASSHASCVARRPFLGDAERSWSGKFAGRNSETWAASSSDMLPKLAAARSPFVLEAEQVVHCVHEHMELTTCSKV